jgi:CRP-like cAMP-binding protein
LSALRPQPAFDNRLLSSLSMADQEELATHLETVPLKFRQRLETANRKVNTVCFIESGLGSIIAVGAGGHRQAEVGIIGREGVSGLSAILGAERSPHETVMQVEGAGWRIGTEALRNLMCASPSLREHLLRYAHVFSVQAAHTALANAQGKIEERLARWLLMANDRLGGNEMNLTHEFLAIMLGVRRAGVTTALHELETAALISTARSRIAVLDREGLRQAANGLYGVPEAEYARLFG